MKTPLISLLAIALGLSVSCKEKSPEVKKIEESTANAVASGQLTKDEAKTINKVAENADEMKEKAGKLMNDQLAALEKATTPEQMKAAVRDATEANIDLGVKSGLLTKEQAELSLKSLEGIDLLPEPALKQMVENLRTALKQAQTQMK